jgi:non-specific serine/threonine protein kinase
MATNQPTTIGCGRMRTKPLVEHSDLHARPRGLTDLDIGGTVGLPTPLTSLVGRENELALAKELLRRPDLRLLTLTGPGGIGKTRLALRLAADLADAFVDGVHFVPLASVRDAGLVGTAIAHAVGVQTTGSATVPATLTAALHDADVLLVVDNFEHVLPAASVVTDLLAASPRLKVLATSRVLLRVSGEHALPVPPLALPAPDASLSVADLADTAAVRLFAERARAVDPAFSLDATTSPLVAEVCRRLDGVPLAIELAAPRVRHLPLPALRNRLKRRLPLLTGGGRDQPSRLQTMRDAIAWSHDLLTPEAQALFGRLSVFVGGFSLEAAEYVGGGAGRQEGEGVVVPDSPSPPSVFDGLAALIDASLLQQETAPVGTARYQMLETLREYAAERLAASGEEQAARRAHAVYFLTLAERHPPAPFLPDDTPWLLRLEAEHANLRAALTWLEVAGEPSEFPRLVAALSWFWWVHGRLDDGRTWMERALARGDPAPAGVRAKIAMVLGFVTLAQGDPHRAERLIGESLALARGAGESLGTAQALVGCGILACAQGEYDHATIVLGDALVLARSLSDAFTSASVVSAALANLGVAAHGRGRLAEAAAFHEDALAMQREVGYVRGAMLSLSDLGDIARDQGDVARAAGYYREGLVLARAYGELRAIVEALEGLAYVAVVSGQARHGVRWFAAAERLRETAGIANWLSFNRTVYERGMSTARTSLGEQAFASTWAAGRSLPLAEAVAEALDAPLVSPDTPGGFLTPRETEVLRLLAVGKSDRAIAEALFLSVRTVEAHVARILAKLGVRTRTAAVGAAVAAGLLDRD